MILWGGVLYRLYRWRMPKGYIGGNEHPEWDGLYRRYNQMVIQEVINILDYFFLSVPNFSEYLAPLVNSPLIFISFILSIISYVSFEI